MGAYTAHILEPSDWLAMKTLRLEAVLREPKSFYRTHDEESAISDTEWTDRCTMTENQKCGFGLFHNGELVGSVELFVQEGRGPGRVVLGRLYVQPEHRGEGATEKLLECAAGWASRQEDFSEIVGAVLDNNPYSRRALESFGFAPAQKDGNAWTETLEWPALKGTPEEKKRVTQTWLGYALPAPALALRKDQISKPELKS